MFRVFSRLFKKRYSKPGTPPGTLQAADTGKPGGAVISVFSYDGDSYEEKEGASPDEALSYIGRRNVTWINVDGLSDIGVMEKFGAALNLHSLALEDVLNIGQRPKYEEYDDFVFIILKMVTCAACVETEQISMFLGKNYLLTFQEKHGDIFGPVRERIRKARGQFVKRGADYLAYSLCDTIVDTIFPVVEQLGMRLEDIEAEVIDKPDKNTSTRIHMLKREFMQLRQAVWPTRDCINYFGRSDSALVHKTTKTYLRDCYDHLVQLMDIIELHRELMGELMDIYVSSISQKLNEVMKVLTIIGTIFIPLTFISSVYGMNFHTEDSGLNMPELTWKYGYPFALGLMALTALSLLYYFRRKRWL
jgi:magnesium transporter